MAKIHLPPLQRLRAFEAAVRLHGFGKAAEELALTQGAISQHILALEEQYGVQFFVRHANGATRLKEHKPWRFRFGRRFEFWSGQSPRFGRTRRAGFDPRREIAC